MKIKDLNIYCPHCNSDTHEKIYNYINIFDKEGAIDMKCFYCDKDFRVKYTIEIYTEYEK